MNRKRKREDSDLDEAFVSPTVNVQTLTCSLRNITSQLPIEKRKKLLNLIEHLVKTTSPLRRDASIFANNIILRQCESGFNFQIHLADDKRWQQFYRACLNKFMKKKSGSTELSNHRKTGKKLAALKRMDPKIIGHQNWLQEIQAFEEDPLTFVHVKNGSQSLFDSEVQHMGWLLRHENRLTECIDEVNNRKLRELRKLEDRFQDETLRIRSTEYINSSEWACESSVNYEMELKGFSGAMLDVLAKEMSTNAQNSLTLTFEARQRKTIMIDFPTYVAQKMCIQINCPRSKMAAYLSKWDTEATEDKNDTPKKRKAKANRRQTLERVREAKGFIQTHRNQIRGNSEALEEKWINETFIAEHSSLILCYFHFLLKRIDSKREVLMAEYKEAEGQGVEYHLSKLPIKMFHLLPLTHYKRCFIDIQPKLFNVITKKLFQDEKVPTRSRNDWSSLFCFDNIRSNPQLVFEGNIKTDGVRACVLFGDGKRKVGKKPRKVVQFQRRKKADEHKQQTEEKMKSPPLLDLNVDSKGLFADDGVQIDPDSLKPSLRGIYVDPGLADIFTAFDSHSLDNDKSSKNGQFRHMSKGEFYHLRKTKVYAKRREFHWKQYLHMHPHIKLDEQCFTTPSSKAFSDACNARSKVDELLWSFYLRKMHSDWAFEMYKAKQRTHVIMGKRILGPKIPRVPTLVAYGDGGFSTSRKGHASTPLKSIPRNLAHHALVIMTKEYNTSKVCPKCKEKTLERHSMRSYKKTKETRIVKRNIGKMVNILTKTAEGKRNVERVQLVKSRHVTFHRRKYEQQKGKGDCFRILACASHCSKKWIFHRDHVACLNIGEACLETIINGKRPVVFTANANNPNDLVEGQGMGEPISTTM